MRSSTGSATSSSSSRPRPSGGASRVGRDGALRLRIERRGAGSVVAGCRSTLPLQVLAPLALDGPAAVVSMLNPTGGLLGGDRLVIEADVGAAAHAVLTTPSASRVYRAPAEPTTQTVRLRAGRGAIVEWVPDHTIPYAGAAFRQAVDCELDEGAALVLLDAFAAGRVAREERWQFRLLESALTVRDARGRVFHDRFVLGAGAGAAGLGGAEGHPYFATVVAVADRGLDAFTRAAGEALAAAGGTAGGVAQLPRRGAVVRCLAASAPALTGALDAVWAAARRTLLGLPPLHLRKP
jgi:urease accessory protein